MKPIFLENETATLALGASIAATLKAGDVIALRGDLGAGKTTLSRGVIAALTGEADVPSPTYTLVQVYEADDCELWHCDMYRLQRAEDCLELGLMDAFEDAICLIEWPDKLGEYLPDTALGIEIVFEKDGRIARFSGWDERIDDAVR